MCNHKSVFQQYMRRRTFAFSVKAIRKERYICRSCGTVTKVQPEKISFELFLRILTAFIRFLSLFFITTLFIGGHISAHWLLQVSIFLLFRCVALSIDYLAYMRLVVKDSTN